MLGENIAALLLLYVRPVAAISRILDRGRLWFAIVAALATSVIIANAPQTAPEVPETPEGVPPQAIAPGTMPHDVAHGMSLHGMMFHGILGYLAPLLVIAVLAVPAAILVRSIRGFGGFGVLMGSDWAPLLMCSSMAFAVAFLPIAIVQFFYDNFLLYALSYAYFLVLFTLIIRTFYGTGTGAAMGTAILAAFATAGGSVMLGVFGPLLYFLGSPMVLIVLYYVFASRVQNIGAVMRNRQHFRQQMEIATTNPRDADAHYQLGLIYAKRRQWSEAMARFQKAVEIDPKEADPHYQLGRIAFAQKRFGDAVGHLRTAAALDDKLAQNEVWRDLGAAYFEAGKIEEASAALQKFTDRREYDPEGLYWYGRVLEKLGRSNEAREMFTRAIESVRTMPPHRRAEVRQWGNAARSELRKI